MHSIFLNYLQSNTVLILFSILFIPMAIYRPKLGVLVTTLIYMYKINPLLSSLFIFFIIFSKNTKEDIRFNLKHFTILLMMSFPFFFLDFDRVDKLHLLANIWIPIIILSILILSLFFIFKQKEIQKR